MEGIGAARSQVSSGGTRGAPDQGGDEGTGESGRTGGMMGQGVAEGALRQVEPKGRRTGVESFVQRLVNKMALVEEEGTSGDTGDSRLGKISRETVNTGLGRTIGELRFRAIIS